jgi:hypothetical protein
MLLESMKYFCRIYRLRDVLFDVKQQFKRKISALYNCLL